MRDLRHSENQAYQPQDNDNNYFFYKYFYDTYSGNEGDTLVGGDAVPSVVPRKVRGIPVVRFAFGTSNLVS